MIEENLDVFLQDLAVLANYKDSQILVFFDNQGLAELGIEQQEITALAKTSDVLNVRHNDFLVINNVSYKIINTYLQDDGKLTKLILKNEQE